MSLKANNTRPDVRRAGFTLIEVLAALAVTAALVAVVLPFAGRLATRWWVGEATVENADAWMQAVARLSDDLSHAIAVPIPRDDKSVVAFEAGPDFVSFVRPGFGDAARTEVDTIRLAIRRTPSGQALVRLSRRFDPLAFFAAAPSLGDAVTLLDGPFRFRFTTIGSDNIARLAWTASDQPPIAVELMVDATAGRPVTPGPVLLPVVARRLPQLLK